LHLIFKSFKLLKAMLKKMFFLAAACSTMMIVSCKDKDKNGGGSPNSWTFKGTTYTAAQTTGSSSGATYQIVGIDGSAKNSLTFTFKEKPTVDGTYKITNNASVLDHNDEVGVGVIVDQSNTYASFGDGSVKATVKVSGGKVSVTIPDLEVKAPTSSETGTLSGVLTEK
jgi:hypothetical protein